jgi:hypothetical protein
MAKVSNKTADLVGGAFISMLKPFEGRVKTLTYDKGKEFCGSPRLMTRRTAQATLPGRLRVGSAAPTRTSMDCFGNMCPCSA